MNVSLLSAGRHDVRNVSCCLLSACMILSGPCLKSRERLHQFESTLSYRTSLCLARKPLFKPLDAWTNSERLDSI